MLILRAIIAISILFSIITSVNGQCVPNSGALTPVLVDSVSVQSNGDIIICWQASLDPDIVWYSIWHKNPLTGSNDSIDVVLAPGSTCYIILAANNNSTSRVEEYAVGVRDLCNNSQLVSLDYHNTIFLEESVDICSASILLNWNAYGDFQSGINVSYEVYASQDGGVYTLVGTTNNTNMVFAGVQQGAIYDIYVRAIENGGTGPFSSSSNLVTVNTGAFLVEPAFLYFYTATVIAPQQIDIQFYVDTAAAIREYEILRASDTVGTFSKIATITAFQGMNPLINYSDFEVETEQQAYVYQINAINLCGDLRLTSNLAQTIFATVVSDKLEAINTLTFSNYIDWLGGVNSYEVYRSVAGVWETSPIISIPNFIGTITYIDNIESIVIGNGEFCYRIVANESTVVHVGNLPEAASTSNEACAIHTPFLYIPNAFVPNGDVNTIFKPIVTYAEPSTYLFAIYDRWGKKIFETNEIAKGWDGSTSRGNSPTGVYVYSVYFQSATGEEFRKTGRVTLIQ